jgi:hypothetical protein
MNKILLIIVLIPIIGFSQINCENSILDQAIGNNELGINPYFQTALGLNLEALSFLQDCDNNINYTLFAPSNNVPNESTAVLFSLGGDLIDYILYYIHSQEIYSSSFTDNELLLMMDGNTSQITGNSISTSEYDAMINQASITTPDICACNGVIHIVDDLIWSQNIHLNEVNKEIKFHIDNNILRLHNISSDSYIEIINIMGRKMTYSKIDNHEINLSNYKQGIYIVTITTRSQSISNYIYIN